MDDAHAALAGETLAVVAHAMLNSMAVLVASADTLQASWDALDPARREELLAMVTARARMMQSTLHSLVRAVPGDLQLTLDRIARG